MRPELQRLTEELVAVRDTLAAVDDPARPATNGWTTAQVLEHLAKSHTLTLPKLAAALDAASERAGADDPVRYSFLDRQVVKTMGGASIKIPVPSIFEPGAAGPEARGACLDSIDALLATIARADGKRLGGLKVASPVNDRLRLGFLPYLEGMVQHARYHQKQVC